MRAFKVHLALVDRVVRNEMAVPAGRSAVSVNWVAVPLSRVCVVIPEGVEEKTPILETPVPEMSTVVPVGTGAVALATRTNPGP